MAALVFSTKARSTSSDQRNICTGSTVAGSLWGGRFTDGPSDALKALGLAPEPHSRFTQVVYARASPLP